MRILTLAVVAVAATLAAGRMLVRAGHDRDPATAVLAVAIGVGTAIPLAYLWS